jgi:hypothetical protein
MAIVQHSCADAGRESEWDFGDVFVKLRADDTRSGGRSGKRSRTQFTKEHP